MTTTKENKRKGIFTGDGKFIACVPWGNLAAVLVHRSIHHRLPYIRLRRWNRHHTKGFWYPTRRYFVVHADHADGLAEALHAAGRNEPLGEEPVWLREFSKDYAAYQARKAAEAKEAPDAGHSDTA